MHKVHSVHWLYDGLLDALEWEEKRERIHMLHAITTGEFIDRNEDLWLVRRVKIVEVSNGYEPFPISDDRCVSMYCGDNRTPEEGCLIVHIKSGELDLLFIHGQVKFDGCCTGCILS